MSLPLRYAPLAILLPLVVAAADAPSLPRDWIDPETGHRIIRLSPDEGASSLYFHQHTDTPEGDRIILHRRGNGGGDLVTVDLTTLGRSEPKLELIAANTRAIAVAWRSREAYSVRRGEEGSTLVAIHLDTKAVREVMKLPALAARGNQFAINCDESLLVGIAPDPEGKVIPRVPPKGGARWHA
jgi:oligogalacturonide lyase